MPTLMQLTPHRGGCLGHLQGLPLPADSVSLEAAATAASAVPFQPVLTWLGKARVKLLVQLSQAQDSRFLLQPPPLSLEGL